jgi:predicted amidohydrolase
MKAGLVQFSPIWEDKKKSMTIIDSLVKNIDSTTSLLIFPEMTLTGFTMNSKGVSEEIDGVTIKYFIDLALKMKIDIIAGIVENDNKQYFNSLFHFTSEGLIKAVYRKIHPFTLAQENEFFSSGKEIVASNYNNHKIGLSICYDLRFPELYRYYAKQKVDLLINIANWPVKRISHWKHLLKARAIENQCFMIGVNRIGNDPFQTYNGCSAVFNPMGEEIIICGNEENIFYADLNFEEVKAVRAKLGFLNDIKMI